MRRQLTEDADFPSDSGEFDFAPAVEDAVVIQPPEEVKLELLRLAASTAKGEAASDAEKDQGRGLVASLELSNPTPFPCLDGASQGTWELVFSDTQLFRSSPFFMAGRAGCSTPEQAKQYDWFCDMHRAALAISQIRRVRQIVSIDKIVSEFEVSAGAVPFLAQRVPLPGMFNGYSGGLPLQIEGAIVSTADIVGQPAEGDGVELLMDTVEIKGSNIPLLRGLLDNGVKLESRQLGSLLEDNLPDYANPKPLFRTTYLDDQLRVCRDQDDKLFVYSKLSDSTSPTDYGDSAADLGIGKLVEGLQTTFL